MPGCDSSDSASEIYLELALCGQAPDPDAFLAQHLEASDAERRRVRTYAATFAPARAPSARVSTEEDPRLDAALDDALRSAAAGDDVESVLTRHRGLGDEDRRVLESLLAREEAPCGGGSALALPARIGRYEVLRQLGEGGMGVVWLARDAEIDRQVVLKTVRLDRLRTGSNALDRLHREARLAGRLDDPAICGVIDLVKEGERTCIVMPFIPGETLAQRLRRGRVAAPAAALLVAKIARAVHTAHEVGIVHRDLKPSNVMIRPDDVPVILDFGLAFEPDADESDRLTREGDVAMTLNYAAPEQLDARLGPIDRRTDVHALGAILYELLTGKQPFNAVTRQETCRRILHADFPAPGSVDGALSRTVDAICLRAMARAAGDRYATALALAEDLERFLRDEPTSARPLSPLGRVAWRIRRHRRAAWSVFAVLVLAAVTTAAVTRWLREAERKELALCAGRVLVSLTTVAPPDEHDVRAIRGLLPDEASRRELDRVLERIASPERLFAEIEERLSRAGPQTLRPLHPIGTICEVRPTFEFEVGETAGPERHFEIALTGPEGSHRAILAPTGVPDHGVVRCELPPPPLEIDAEYLWTLRLDPAFHSRKSVEAFRSRAVRFRVVDPSERDAAVAMRRSGNDSADRLLAAIALLARDLASDARQLLDLFEPQVRGATWYALAAAAALDLDDPEGARRLAEAGFGARR